MAGYAGYTSIPTQLHPRRKPAHQSVSLRQPLKRPASSLQKEYTGDGDTPDASTTSDLERNNSSGETSNADHWFEKSNKHPKLSHASYRDDDPPFEPDMSTPSANAQPYTHMMPMPSALQSTGSSSEEYRDVIDDLTIQIKKLKKKLKKYERLQDHRLDEEKCVEVKTYGLRPEKKRELEALLSRFTSSLDEDSPRIAVATSSSAFVSGTSGARPGSSLTSHAAHASASRLKPSDSVSTAVFADSGYGSLAHTGGKRSVSTSATEVARRPSQQVAVAQARDEQIESYLQDMSAGMGLLPRPALTMGDKAKKQLIVMRLEQILGGREAEAGVHHQSLQQEEVSRSAAHAERSAMEALGQLHRPEGVREALIMPDLEDQDMTMAEYQLEPSNKKGAIAERDFATNGDTSSCHEQRPTRPLDLDPDRAQSASENVQYLRHLGFTLENRDMLTANSDSQGWIYLNLMIGLAQLHSYNVTTSFVREAIARYSKKFELSRDGRKVRWRSYGGRFCNDDPASILDPATGVPAPEGRRRSLAAMEPEVKLAQHIYTPLFPPKQESMSEEGSDSVEDLLTIPQNGHSGDLMSALASGSNPMTAHSHDAPMIFYNQARFYTDLSADPAMSILGQTRAAYTGNRCPLGEKPTLRFRQESYLPSSRALIHTTIPEEAEPIDSEVDMTIDFPQHSPRRVAFIEDDDIALEASGLGGVYPEDHFSLTVRCQHNLNGSTPVMGKTSSFPNRLFPYHPNPMRKPIYRNQILSTKRTNLPPSELPEPSFGLILDDSDSGSDADESDHSVSHDVASTIDMPRLVSTSAFGPGHRYDRGYSSSPAATDASTTPARSASHRAHADEDEAYSSASSATRATHEATTPQRSHEVRRRGSTGARSSAIDFLAHARAVNPSAIRAMERRYDADVADRLAEEIPAGSSAATAGGGSGWGSPIGAGRASDAPEGEAVESDQEVECGSVCS